MGFVVTAWRDEGELLEVRAGLYPWVRGEDRREWAANKVFAWRLRQFQIPLLLESTADIVDVMLQDEKKGLEHNALRLLYATAVSRFVTGVADTLIDLKRLRPSWFLPGQSLALPHSLLETRHRIVHRQLPSLAALKNAAQQSLDLLWECYWSQLDMAFSHGDIKPAASASPDQVKAALQPILKAYIKARKTAIKTRKTAPEAGEANSASSTAMTSYHALHSSDPTFQQHHTSDVLLELLITDTAILPSDKKLGTSMSGAFLIWTPLLTALCTSTPSISSLPTLVDRLMRSMNAASPFGVPADQDPVKEGMHAWLVRISTNEEWSEARRRAGRGVESRVRDDVLGLCFTAPSTWNLRLAESILQDGCWDSKRGGWERVLDAALNEAEENRDREVEAQIQNELAAGRSVARDVKMREKESGPRKRLGLWRPTHIGTLPVGWEDDE